MPHFGKAKFRGWCSICEGHIIPGQWIVVAPGCKAIHYDCSPKTKIVRGGKLTLEDESLLRVMAPQERMRFLQDLEVLPGVRLVPARPRPKKKASRGAPVRVRQMTPEERIIYGVRP